MWFIILIGLFLSPVSHAQELPEAVIIQGMVIDENGIPIPGVVVRLESLPAAKITDNDGRFGFDQIPPGGYTISADKPGSSLLHVKRYVEINADHTDPIVITMRYRSYAMDEVVVIGTPLSTEERQEDAPSQVDIITRAEFEQNAATVEDVIASTPSATIRSYGGLGAFSEVSLRGSYSNQVNVYLDGMLLNEAIGGSVNLGLIPLTNVDRIEVWRSGAPSQFGGDAVGGAINIVTRDVGETAGAISLGFGSFETVNGYGVAGFGPSDSRLLLTLDAATSRNNYDYTSDNGTPLNSEDDYTTYRRNNDFRTLNSLVKYRHTIGNSVILELSEHLLHARNNLPSTQHILNSHASLTTTKNLFQSRLVWIPAAHPWIELSPTSHIIISREHYEDKSGHVGWGEQDNIYETRTFQGMLPITIRQGSYGELTLTPLAVYESYKPKHRLEPTIPLSSDREHLGIVGDAEIHSPGRHIVLTANLRRDRYYSEYQGQVNSFTPYSPEPQRQYFTNIQIGTKIALLSLVSFRWNYSDNWRPPSFYELFGDRGGVVANSFIKPEHVYRWDAGIRMTLPAWSRQIAGSFDIVRFENTYRNLIQWYSNSYGFITPANVAGSYVRGTELVWNLLIFGNLGIRGNWTYQQSKVTDSPKSYHMDKKLPNRPNQHGTATLEYTHNSAAASWTIDHQDAYYLDRSNQPHMRYPGRTLHNVSLSLAFQENRLICRLMADNVTDKKTFDIQGMPKPGRSYTIQMQYTL